MKLLVENVAEFVDFLEEQKITADQFLFCVLLSSEREKSEYDLPDKDQAISRFYKYKSLVVDEKEFHPWVQEDLMDLVDKGFLINNNDDGQFKWEYFEVTDKFIDLVFEKKDDVMDQYQEFWDEYPARYEGQNGQMFNIKAVNKEELFGTYKKALEKEDHETIMECLKLAKQKDEVNCRPDKWLNSHQWEVYVDEIDEDVSSQSIQQTVL